jgi:hypothetical protein
MTPFLFFELFEVGDRADISEIYAAIQAKSGRYIN